MAMSKHIFCLNKNTAGTAGTTLASGRLNRAYLTLEERDEWLKDPNRKGITYLIQSGTVEELERDLLEAHERISDLEGSANETKEYYDTQI